jgi:heme oxygenase
MPNLPDAPAIDLAQRVREATQGAHSAAETRPFIADLMGGALSLADYERYLAQYAWVYEALEARGHRADDPAILDPALDRFSAIESDLGALGAGDWRAKHPMLESTAAYVRHLTAIRPDDLPRYLAHHYTRYLGDLSGGQAIARLVARHYGATDAQLSFYRFDGIDAVPFKRAYRDDLDALGFDEAESTIFVDEASAAFRFNSAMFDDLAR